MADKREQELPVHDESEDDNELVHLEYQPEQGEEAAGNATLMSSRGEGDRSERVAEVAQHLFFQLFSTEERERKLSDENQQEEAKRPKSPEREDVQLAEQHGSGGEGGEEMEREMGERLSFCMTEEHTQIYIKRQVQIDQMLDSARRQQHFK